MQWSMPREKKTALSVRMEGWDRKRWICVSGCSHIHTGLRLRIKIKPASLEKSSGR